MEEILRGIFLGTVQGFTEFIPVSSSGHLALLPRLFGMSEQSTAFDIVVHGGTLLALLLFFRLKISTILKGVKEKDQKQTSILKKVIIGSLPALIVAGLIELSNIFSDNKIDGIIKSNEVLIFMLISVGLLLIAADFIFKNNSKTLTDLKVKNIIIIGVAQILSLLRGTSRSGITIFAGMSQGLKREEAAEYSFLMGIPVIALGFVFQIVKFLIDKNMNESLLMIFFGFLTSFIFGYIAIAFLLNFLKKYGLTIFGVYRIILGVVALIVLFR